ncbi:hypothetical protein RJ639_010790 [Escallonia herrerae]|uniref:Uncharacterized protein n=1 Tax=Escallonia herrerae TaxID=1293975 RepID=A0AA88VN04_9ASTE|nr:hypothetical protein RJ639_010790 [Escallonia herrerae]
MRGRSPCVESSCHWAHGIGISTRYETISKERKEQDEEKGARKELGPFKRHDLSVVSSKDEELFMQTAYAVPAVAPAHSPLKAPAPPLLVKPPVPAPLPNPPPSAPLPPPKTTKDCYPLCAVRCKLHSRKNLCLRACVTCCDRCKCVPPGQYGNYDKCNDCYSNMTTRGGRRKLKARRQSQGAAYIFEVIKTFNLHKTKANNYLLIKLQLFRSKSENRSFQKVAVTFSICFALTALLGSAEMAMTSPAPAPSHATSGIASSQSMLVGIVGAAISFFVLKEVV